MAGPGEKIGPIGPFASDEVGGRVGVPITQWSPTFVGTQARTLPADLPTSPSAGPSGAALGGWVAPCNYQLVDLAALRPGSGSAPDGRLQGQADALEGSYRAGAGELHQQLGQQHSRLTDFTGGPSSGPSAPRTPPG